MVEIATSIVAATVYPDRARLTRRGSVKVDAGMHSIEICELPISLYPDTLHASVYGVAGTRLLGVEVKHTYYSEQPTEVVRHIEQQIETAQDELKQLEDKLELIKQNRIILDKLANQTNIYATGLAAGEITVEKQLGVFRQLRSQAQKLDEESHGLQVNRRKVERELEKLNKELEQIHNARPLERYTASVAVETPKAGDLAIEISYITSGAAWTPVYDVRLLEKEGSPSLEISYLADVIQNTGEAWDGISLTLSTAKPALTSVLPELDPWYIRPVEQYFPRPRVMAQALPSPELGEQLPSGFSTVQEAQVGEKADELIASVNTVGTSVSYIIPHTVSISSSGSTHKVTIARFFLVPLMDYVSAPKQAQAVYRRAMVDNSSPYTLLPGDATILIGDEYVGTAPFMLTVPGGKIELYLGSENRIKVERELKRREVDKRVMGGKRHLVFGYEIKLENMLHDRAKITLHDQIPVPDNVEIKVRLESADPKTTEQSELNLLKWELFLEPKEKRSVRFDFSIDTPPGMDVLGLP